MSYKLSQHAVLGSFILKAIGLSHLKTTKVEVSAPAAGFAEVTVSFILSEAQNDRVAALNDALTDAMVDLGEIDQPDLGTPEIEAS